MSGTPRLKPRRSPARDMRWLELRGRTFYAVQAVPRPLWATLGKKRFGKSLGTHDYRLAVARRHAALAEFQRTIDHAGELARSDNLTEAALSRRSRNQ